MYAQAPAPNPKLSSDYIRAPGTRDHFMNGQNDYEDINPHHKNLGAFDPFPAVAPGLRDSLSSFKAPNDLSYFPSTTNGNLLSSPTDIMMPIHQHDMGNSFHLYADNGHEYTISPNGTMGSFKGSPPAYRSLHFSPGHMSKVSSESTTHSAHTMTSLIGDESPYSTRLIRDRLIDPDSPYRIINRDSPYRKPIEIENPNATSNSPTRESPYRLIRKDYTRSSALERKLAKSLNISSTLPPRSPVYAPPTDLQSSLRSGTPNFQRQLSSPDGPLYRQISPRETNGGLPGGADFLYKRPPSPLSPPISSRKSNDSLQRSPSTPHHSPSMARRRLDGLAHKTPPMSHRRKVKDMGLYDRE